jgi:hypothetical protein
MYVPDIPAQAKAERDAAQVCSFQPVIANQRSNQGIQRTLVDGIGRGPRVCYAQDCHA